MKGFGCCQTSWVAMPDLPNILSHIRYENYRATFTATCDGNAYAEKICDVRDQFVFAMLSLMFIHAVKTKVKLFNALSAQTFSHPKTIAI